MKCDCLICRKDKVNFVNELINQGNSFSQILKELRKTHKVSEGVLEKHLRLTGNERIIPTKEVKAITKITSNQFDFNSINFDKYNFDQSNPETVIEYLQKALLFMYMRQLEIVASEQENKYNGEEVLSSFELLKLEKIEGMLQRIYPIHLFANQRTAFDVVARMGYKVILDVQTDTDTQAIYEDRNENY